MPSTRNEPTKTPRIDLPALMTTLGIVLVHIVYVLCIIGFLVWNYSHALQQRISQEPLTDKPSITQKVPLDTYTFSAVPVNTHGWIVYQPLIGFSFKYPRELRLDDTGPQKVATDGSANQFRNLQTVTLIAPNTTQASIGITRGMLYTLIIDLDDNDLSTPDLCRLYTTGQINFTDGSHKVCETRQANSDYIYVTKHGARSYSLELAFVHGSTAQQRNAAISQAREIVNGFTFAN
jgi:hypothetical protein